MNENDLAQLARMISNRLMRTTFYPLMTLQLATVICIASLWTDRAHAQEATEAATSSSSTTSSPSLTLALPDDDDPPAPNQTVSEPVAEAKASSTSSSEQAPKEQAPAAQAAPAAEVVTSAEVAATTAVTSPAVASQQELAADAKPTVAPEPKVAPEPTVASAVASESPVTPAPVPEPEPVRELSVAPQAKPLLPADRPAWVGGQPDLSGKDHRLFVGSFPTMTADEADSALDEPLVEAVTDYLNDVVLPGGQGHKLAIDSHFIRTNLLESSPTFMAELSTQVGSMYQKWVVLKITPEQREHFVNQYAQVVQRDRAIGLGAGLLAVLALVGGANLAFRRARRRHQLEPLSAMFMRGPAVDAAPNNRQAETARLVSLPVINTKSNKKKNKRCCSRGSAFVPIAIVFLVLGINVARKKMDAQREAHAAPPQLVEVHVPEPPTAKEDAQSWHQEAKMQLERVIADAKKAIAKMATEMEQPGKTHRTRISVGKGDKFIEITHDSSSETQSEPNSSNPKPAVQDEGSDK